MNIHHKVNELIEEKLHYISTNKKLTSYTKALTAIIEDIHTLNFLTSIDLDDQAYKLASLDRLNASLEDTKESFISKAIMMLKKAFMAFVEFFKAIWNRIVKTEISIKDKLKMIRNMDADTLKEKLGE